MEIALVTLLDLLSDDEHMGEVEQLVRGLGVSTPEVQLGPRGITAAADQPMEAYRLSRGWYVDLVEAGFDDAHVELPATRACVAYLAAAFAARAGRLHDARRWLLLGHIEAEADGLGAEELAVFVAAIRYARG